MLSRTTLMIVGHYLCLFLMIALLGLPANTGASSSIQCPSNWTKIDGKCFGYFKERVSFEEADRKCRSFSGGRLASLHNQKEACAAARYIYNFDDTKDVWIGLSDPKKNRQWVWTDGSKFDYKAWDVPKQPDNFGKNEYCTQLMRSFAYTKWNDMTCDAKSPYLCKLIPKIPPLPPFPKECS